MFVRSATHKLSGVIAAAGFYWLASVIDFPTAPHMAVGVILGSTAPDWLEIPSWQKDGARKSVIPHRSITHWVAMWSFLLSLAALWPSQHVIKYILAGFAFGGLMHCLLDGCTPMGVPTVLPWRRKKSRRR